MTRTDGAGRRLCQEPGCRTALSRYHLDDRCAKHGGWTDPGDRVHQRRRQPHSARPLPRPG